MGAASGARAHTARSPARRHARVALALALLAAVDGVALAPARRWRLYTYDVPLEALGVPAPAAERYRARVREGPTRAPWDVGGVAQSLARELPRVMPAWAPPRPPRPGVSWSDPGRVLYFLPVAPFVLCMSTAEHRNASFVDRNGMAKGMFPWLTDHLAMGAASKRCELDARRLCPAYAAVLEWLVAQPSWAGREHLHVVPASFSADVPRAAFACAERRAIPEAQRPVLARLARSILLSMEGRTWAWRADVAAGRLVHLPYYVPPEHYLLSARAEELPSRKPSRVALVTVQPKVCHRFDDPTRPDAFHCATSAAALAAIDKGLGTPPADAPPADVRAALALAVKHAHASTGRRVDYGLRNMLRKPSAAVASFGAEYRRATFTLVPPGDTLTSSRIHGALAALSIPVFLVPLGVLPFGHTVPWEALSVQLSPTAVLKYAAEWERLGGGGGRANGTGAGAPRRRRRRGQPHGPERLRGGAAGERVRARRELYNPLRALERLEREAPERVARMQSLLARHRWSVLYHNGSEALKAVVPFDEADAEARGGVPPSEWPSAARSLAAELVIAGERRLRTRADDGAMHQPGKAAPGAVR